MLREEEKKEILEEIKQYLRKKDPYETTVDRFIQAVDEEGDANVGGDVLNELVAYIRHAFEHGQQGAPAFIEHVQRICSRPPAKRVLAAALAKDPQFAGMDIDEYCLRPVAAEAELYQEQLPRAKRTRSGPPSPPRADARPNPQPVITEHAGETVMIDGRPHYISFPTPREAPITARMSKRMRVDENQGGSVYGTEVALVSNTHERPQGTVGAPGCFATGESFHCEAREKEARRLFGGTKKKKRSLSRTACFMISRNKR